MEIQNIMGTDEESGTKITLPSSATIITALLTLVLSGVVKIASNFYTDYLALSNKITELQIQLSKAYATKDDIKELSNKVDQLKDKLNERKP